MPFRNQVISGGGQLVRTLMRSANFNVANPAASPPQSWAVYQNGQSYFFGVTLTGGNLVVAGAGGVFVYTGTPALGNPPIASMTGSTVDPFGNAVKPEIAVYGSGGSTVQMLAGAAVASLFIGTGDAGETNKAVMSSTVAGAGVTRQLEMLLQGPSMSTSSPNDGIITFDIASGSADQVSQQPFLDMIAKSNNGLAFLDIFLSPTVFGIGSLLTITGGALPEATFGTPVIATTGTAIAQSKISTDSWNSLGSPGIANVTVESARYALLPVGVTGVNMLAIDVALMATGAVAAGVYAFANLLSGTYQFPGNYSRSYAVGFNGSITTATNNSDLLVDGAASANPGRVRLQIPALPVNTSITVTCLIPLN
jgi:hypothetical protein